VTSFGQGAGIWLYGTEGVLHYDLTTDRIRGASQRRGAAPVDADTLQEIRIPEDQVRSWRVEADFVDAIREGAPIHFTDFATGVQYMEFTEAVARSAQRGLAIDLPLEEFDEPETDQS